MGFKSEHIQIDGSLNIDGSVFQWQQPFVGGGSGGGGDVAWASGNVGSNNQMITAGGDGSIVSESNLTFDGTTVGVTGNIKLSNDISVGQNLFIDGDIYNAGMDASVKSNVVYYDTTTKQLTYGIAPVTDISTLSIESYVNSSTYYDSSLAYLKNHLTLSEPSTGLSNYESQGIYCTFVAANTISSFYTGYVNTSGRLALADADASNMMPAVALNTTGASMTAGNTYSVLIYGVVYNSAWNFTAGKQVYVGLSGEVTSTKPTAAVDCVQVIGTAISPDSIIFNPSPDVIVLK